jgi:hypothetical protein
MRKWDCLSAIVLAAIGLAAIYEAVQGIGIGTFAQTDPGFYPFWLAIVLVFLSIILFVSNLGTDEQPLPFWEKGAWYKPCLAIAVLLGYFILIAYIGFIVATVYVFLAWMMIVEKESFKKSAIVAIAITGIVYLVFVALMGISFPEGLLI